MVATQEGVSHARLGPTYSGPDLPPPPKSQIVLLAHTGSPIAAAAVRALEAAVRAGLRWPGFGPERLEYAGN